MNKFYNFISNNNKSELYLYGAIVSEKWSEDDVDFKDFKTAIDKITDNSTLEVYVNSPGGEVFVTQSIISLLKRAKATKNITLNCYIDGLGASCASWLPMLADNLYIYNGSILMLHKPLSMVWGNANEMRKEIELLDKIENSEMIPMYMSKAKETLTEDILKDMLSEETWLTSDEIENYFNVTRLEDDKKMVASVDKELFDQYKNVPESLKDTLKDTKEEVDQKAIEVVEDLKEKELNNKKKLLELELNLL
ncbi:Clp protease [Clostridium sartagoforme AAU1]|uniref:Clp protease n=1 Tax=Clostridium sartagoforme AAU1 TaxID=1202534 RepID=R9CDU1_9CLOT|nr:head maturation protease, ClpP-related [Clostridium sartagoforme]EOR27467.1 Clp protease [Clostridium sartagoforme AAU1]